MELPDEEQRATELQLLSVRCVTLSPVTNRWSAFVSVEVLVRVFSLRVRFKVSQTIDCDFLLPFLEDGQSITLRFLTTNQAALAQLESCLTDHARHLSCPVQRVQPSALKTQQAVITNSRGELSLSQTVRGCKSSVVAMTHGGREEEKEALFSSTLLHDTTEVETNRESKEVKELKRESKKEVEVKEKKVEEVKEKERQRTPSPTGRKQPSSTKEAVPEVTVIPATQDSPLDATPLLPSNRWVVGDAMTRSGEKNSLQRSASIDALSSLHSTPKKPRQEKELSPVRITTKPAEAPPPQERKETVATQMAGLSRRKGMSFLSQLLDSKEDSKEEVKKEPKESKKEVKRKEYTRKWQMPSKPKEMEKEETVVVEGEKTKLPRKRPSAKKPQKREAPRSQVAGRKKARVEEPQSVVGVKGVSLPSVEGVSLPSVEGVSLPSVETNAVSMKTKNTTMPEKENTTPSDAEHVPQPAQTKNTLPPLEEHTIPAIDVNTESDFSSEGDDETVFLMDKFKTILSTPKLHLQSTDSTPSSTGSESEEEEPGILAIQQVLTGTVCESLQC